MLLDQIVPRQILFDLIKKSYYFFKRSCIYLTYTSFLGLAYTTL